MAAILDGTNGLTATGGININSGKFTVDAATGAVSSAAGMTLAGAVSGITTLGCGAITTTGDFTRTGTGSVRALLVNTTASTGKRWQFNSYNDGHLYVGVDGVADYLDITSSGLAVAGAISGTTLSVSGSVSGYTGSELYMSSTANGGASAITTQLAGAGVMSFDHRATSNTGSFQWHNGTVGANLLMSLSSTGLSVTGTLGASASANGVPVADVTNTHNTSGDSVYRGILGTNCADTSSYHFIGQTGAANVVFIHGSGDMRIAAGKTYGNMSDAKLKENIVDATPKLDDVCKLRVRNFSLIGEPDSKCIGYIAQEFEQVFPALVSETDDLDGDLKPLGTKTKGIKESALIAIHTKAIQELAARVAALEGASK